MREIKFRAWDGTQMYSPIIDEKGNLFRSAEDYLNNDKAIHDNLMQFTGLHDRTEREIYEGDIVNVKSNEPFERVDGIHVIEWWSGQFVFKANSKREEDYINFGWWSRSNNNQALLKQIEVIGNIYENTELLKGGE